LTHEKPSEVGWLHWAVAVCSALVIGAMLLLVPLFLAVGSGAPELLVLYKFVFSKWGVAALLASSALGFVIGGERMANFFAVIWGTHPV
jgi:hypothetical protein